MDDDLGMVRALRALSTRMGGIVGFFEALDGDVSVDLRGGEVGVAEEFLDAAEIGAAVKEVCGVAVAEFVGGDFGIEAGAGKISFEAGLNDAGGDRPRS